MTKFIERIGSSLTLRMTLGTAVMLVPLVALGSEVSSRHKA